MRHHSRSLLITLTTVLLLTSRVFALEPEPTTKSLSPRAYFKTALNEINKAQASVDLCMYLISFYPKETDSQVYQLMSALAKAKARGVAVRVILDQDPTQKNLAAAQFLKQAGVPVFWDSELVTTHTKALVMDGETVLVGSTNWSESAFSRNNESNAFIRSKEFAEDLLAEFAKIKTVEAADPDGLVVKIPVHFLSADIMGEMVNESDDRAMDTYLWLLKEGKSELDYEKLAEALGLSTEEPIGYRRQINKTLEKLEQKYLLIQVTTEYGKPAQVKMDKPNGGDFSVPLDYWTLGWDRELSFPAKVMLLLNRYYSQDSSNYPKWRKSVAGIAEERGISQDFVSTGTMSLRRWNLIEVRYDSLYADDAPRVANEYTPKPLYDRKEEEVKLRALVTLYGKEGVERARAAANAVYEDHDMDGVEKLVQLENRYSLNIVQAALKVILEKSPDNPKRSLAYLIRTIERMGEKGFLAE